MIAIGYAEMLGEKDNGWLELCKVKIFEVPINLWIFHISIEGNFVVRANVNIALGANLEYEIGKRYINWFSIFGNGSGAEEIDLVDERFAFQFYAMGHVGLKAGILIEVKVGIISTKIGTVGISAEVGAFAELYSYFQYTYTKMRPAGGTEWEEEESLMGALAANCLIPAAEFKLKYKVTQTNLLNALGIPHSFHIFPSFSNSFCFRVFQVVNASRFVSALAPVNEEKEGEKEKISHTLLHSHSVRALCTVL